MQHPKLRRYLELLVGMVGRIRQRFNAGKSNTGLRKSTQEGSQMNEKDKLVSVVTYMVTATLCAVVLALIGALIHGLFVREVDNTKIFEIIGPAFQTIIGGLIGWLSGLKVGSNKDEELPCKKKD
jgi:undecaprenyl pyrophosphate phosphatase UppP